MIQNRNQLSSGFYLHSVCRLCDFLLLIGVGMRDGPHPSLQTGLADLPHTAFQSVVSTVGLKPIEPGILPN